MELIEEISYVKRAKNRQKVLIMLETPAMPSEIAKKVFGSATNTYFNLTSRALKELTDKELVKVLNEFEKVGRMYQRTKTGDKVVSYLKK